jgi:hypothetical protein
LIIILVAVISLTSCEDWNLIGMKVTGPIVSRDIENEEVEGIILEIPASVTLKQGDVQSISIDAQENILNNIDFYNSNGILKIKFSEPVSKSEPIKIYMTIKSLKEASISGSGAIESINTFAREGNLKIAVTGSGSISLHANANWADLLISGSGDINLFSDCKDINGEINGSGDINLNGGSSETAIYYISGSGNINAFPFISESCTVKTNGSGNVKVNISDILNVNINGSGDVYYQGNPQISAKVNGSGKVMHSK